MNKRRLYEPGDMVASFSGELGIVLSEEGLARVRGAFKEGGRAGRFFAPGCCQKPDYVTQVPVFFEDGAYDVMRAMNVRKKSDVPKATRKALEQRLRVA